ncbi:helix-turn-helix domain-containing protein [Mycolicibacterium fortuitum]|uniref:helix-turn-helix domain-containing protein n=1 Tax=Mycolicibacterium fortuitum TaxID=1766 RepID=UPI0009005B8A|nr:helix-turn-helix domain-containing protein [Mycolicibacterium fortuitum]
MSELPELLTPEQTAEWLGMSVDSLSQNRYLRNDRSIPHVKVGGRVRYLKDDLIAYVNKNRVAADGKTA